MKHILLTAITLALASGLAACDQKPAPDAKPPAGNVDMAAMAASAKMAKGAGTVTAADADAGTVTIDHGPIAEANWPAMTMTFKTSPDIAKQVKAGDKVAFDLKLQGANAEVTAIRKP